jgi:hypothetical protein
MCRSRFHRILVLWAVIFLAGCSPQEKKDEKSAGRAPAPDSAKPSPAPEKPILLGEEGRTLTDRDIEALHPVLPGGVKPWLIAGDFGEFRGNSFQLFLSPEIATPHIRRGKAVQVYKSRPDPKGAFFWETWAPNADRLSDSFAQVAIAGRGFYEIENVRDRNRPFFVIGEFSDDELISLVQFARMDTSLRAEVSVLPILSVMRGVPQGLLIRNAQGVAAAEADGAVTVCFRDSPTSWAWVVVRPKDDAWIFVRESFSEA